MKLEFVIDEKTGKRIKRLHKFRIDRSLAWRRSKKWNKSGIKNRLKKQCPLFNIHKTNGTTSKKNWYSIIAVVSGVAIAEVS